MNRKALLLLSGGFDSPVAGWLIKKKYDLELYAIHFHSMPLTDEKSIQKSKELAKIIGIKKLFLVPFTDLQKEVVQKCKHKDYYILTRRLMWKIAEQIAKQNDCKYLVTGENLAQVASQTLSNITNIDEAVDLVILRPLLTYDKEETINLAKEIGTYEASKGEEICCLLGPKHPSTKSNLQELKEQEKNIDEKIIHNIIEKIEVVNLIKELKSSHLLEHN